jgi:2-polyprenyl-6-methoxyphenol hydroxylase-like FAD-dependent oxidoreductase
MAALHSWTNADTSTAITNVLPMGSLQNTLRSFVDGRPSTIGLISVGDALCHTDPVFALGLSFGMVEARELTAAIEAHRSDLEAIALALDAAVREPMTKRFANATAVDGLRLQPWQGEAVDVAHRDGGRIPSSPSLPATRLPWSTAMCSERRSAGTTSSIPCRCSTTTSRCRSGSSGSSRTSVRHGDPARVRRATSSSR